MKLSNWSGERLEWHYVRARAQSGRRSGDRFRLHGIASCQGFLHISCTVSMSNSLN